MGLFYCLILILRLLPALVLTACFFPAQTHPALVQYSHKSQVEKQTKISALLIIVLWFLLDEVEVGLSG
jgi:hypothetical protein